MGSPNVSNISHMIKPVRGNAPAAQTAGAVNGASIDALGYGSLDLFFSVGATTGSPTSFTVDAAIQDSDDGTTFAAITAATASIAQVTAINTDRRLSLDLSLIRRYVRVVSTVAFVGGTTPAALICSVPVLGGAVIKPAA